MSTRIASVESIALGVSDVIPIEMTSAYATIANEGVYNSPNAISYIEDQHGRVIKRFNSEQMEVVDENLNYIMLSMMKDVIDSGTGGSIRWRHKFKSPMAGKTGTTNNKTDAWFIGFTPQIALGVWVGVDDPSISLGKKQYGSKAALPIFADAIKEIYNLGTFYSGTDLVYIDQDLNWEMPDGVVFEKVCSETYEKATRWCESIDEIYLDDTKPTNLCENHSGALKKKIRK